MTCADTATNGRTSHSGALVEIVFLCETAGTTTLTLTDESNTFVLADNFDTLNDHVHDASITCGGDAATATVAAPTATAAAGSPTAAAGSPTAAAPAPTSPTGGTAPVVSGPDTGTGHDSGSNGLMLMLIGLAVFVVAAGASLNVAGAAVRRRARR